MSSSLVINGRSFIAVRDAAGQVGRAEAYVVRLAYEKWIDGYQIEGEWFVNVDSLSRFLLTAEADVYEQAALAARRRKAMAQLAALRAREMDREQVSWTVIGQVGVVVLCGCLVAVLGMSSLGAQLRWQDFQAGVVQTSVSISESIVVPVRDFALGTDPVMQSDSVPTSAVYYPSRVTAWLKAVQEWWEQ